MKAMPGRESRTAHWTRLQRCEQGDQPHLSPLNNSDISTSINSDAGLKASSLQAVSSNLGPSRIWISCRQEKQDMGFIASDGTIADPDTTVVLNNGLSFYPPFINLFCPPLFWKQTFGKVATKLGAGTKFYLAERNRESSFFFYPAHSWRILSHYRLLLQSLCYSPVSTNIYTHATSI